ncbi:MAG: hypothetical protein AAGI46_02040 [Planctomycetota bacterium]
MSEHICHVACAFDTRNLCRALGPDFGIEAAFNEVWNDPANDLIAQFGGVTRRADNFSAEMIAYCRQESNKGGPDADPNWRKKLTFTLSALSHRSIDRHMKPVFMHFKQATDAAKGFNECTMYCDVMMLRKRFGRGTIMDGDMLDPAKQTASDDLASLARETIRRELIRMHTFNPDDDHIHTWLDEMIGRAQQFNLRLAEYDRIFTNPDPDRVRQYLDETNFYDETSPLIQITQRLANGESVEPAEVDQAVATTETKHGRYARTLAHAVGYVRSAGKLWRGEQSIDDTKPQFDIGNAELAMVYPEPGERAYAG